MPVFALFTQLAANVPGTRPELKNFTDRLLSNFTDVIRAGCVVPTNCTAVLCVVMACNRYFYSTTMTGNSSAPSAHNPYQYARTGYPSYNTETQTVWSQMLPVCNIDAILLQGTIVNRTNYC